MRIIIFTLTFVFSYAAKLPKGLVVNLDDNDPKTKESPVYDGSKLNPKYDLNVSKSLYSCTPDYAYQLVSEGTKDFYLTMLNQKENETFTIDSYEIINSFVGKLMFIFEFFNIIRDVNFSLTQREPAYPTTLNYQDITNFTLNHTCYSISDHYNETNYWTDVQLMISYNRKRAYILYIQYQVTCDPYFRVRQFNSTLLLMIIISTIVITFFARLQNIVSIRIITAKDQYSTTYFQGFYLNYIQVIVYGCLYALVGLLAMAYNEQMQSFLLVLSIIISFIFSTFFIDEMVCMLPTGFNLKKELFSVIKISDIVSAILAGILILTYYLTGQAWYINDILALLLTGAFIKLFKFRNGKDAIIILLAVIFFDCILGIIVHEIAIQSYNILVLKSFNCPLELQLPLFTKFFDRKCSWISVVNVILPGLFIGYSIRFDFTKDTKIYTVLSFIGLILGSMIWIIVQVFNKHQWPQSIFIYPTMLIITLLWAEKRGELKSYLMGTFYDKFLFLSRSQRAQSILSQENGITLRQMIVEESTTDNSNKIKISATLFQGFRLLSIFIIGLSKVEEASFQQEEEKDSQQALLNSDVIKRY